MTAVSIANPVLGDAERRAVTSVLESGQLAAGEEVATFESRFAERCDVEHAVGTANGTAALHAALVAAGVGAGDAVVTTPFSFVATANAIRFAGGKPIFADVDPATYNLDPHDVEAIVREREDVAAILPVHLYGLPAPMDHLQDVAETHDLALVEDAAQAHGATHADRPVGSIGDVGCFSFYPTKNMTTGEGGIVTTDDPSVAAAVRRFVDHGRRTGDGGYEHVELGHNFRMPEVAAAIGNVQLDRLSGFVSARRENAARLDRALADAPAVAPVEPDDTTHVYHQYTVRVGNRETVRSTLADRGIDSAVYYPAPIHRQPAYDGVEATTPTADRLAEEVLSVPVHPNVAPADAGRVGRAVAAAAEPPGDGG